MRARADLPFERDQSTRFLPWIVALMVFLGMLTLAGALAVADAVEAWDSSLTGRLTVQIPAATAQDGTAGRVAELIRLTPGVTSVRAVPDSEARALLVPWLGEGAVEADLPIPALVDVTVAPGARLDTEALRARLEEAAPGTSLDDHRIWLSSLIDLGHTVEAVAFLILALIAAAAVAAVVFTTRSGLAVHAGIIELLHLMGARDGYIADQFQTQAMMLGLRGGIAGALAAAIVLGTLAWIGRGLEAAFLPPVALDPLQIALLLVVPAAAVAIAMLTARRTVLRALAGMP